MCNNTKKRTMKRISNVDITENGVEWTLIQLTLKIKSLPLRLDIDIPNTEDIERPSLEEFTEALEFLSKYKESILATTVLNLSPRTLEYIAHLARERHDGVVDLLEEDIEFMNLLETNQFFNEFNLEFKEVYYGQHE